MKKYFLRPDSNIPPKYTYIEGEDTDILWDEETCIEVEPQPNPYYRYNMEINQWKIDENIYMYDLREKRNLELTRTDKYVLPDFPITAENLAIVQTYRQDLRDCPNKENLEDRVLPECPEICR